MNDGWVTGDRIRLRVPRTPRCPSRRRCRIPHQRISRIGCARRTETRRADRRVRKFPAAAPVARCCWTSNTGDPQPGLHTELFVKFSRDFDDPVRDRGRTQMESEVGSPPCRCARGFPIAVPRTQFADYHRDTGTGILISERIRFGTNGIEPQYHKCLDYEMPRPARALPRAAHRRRPPCGHPSIRTATQPAHRAVPGGPAGATVGEPPPLTPDKLHRRSPGSPNSPRHIPVYSPPTCGRRSSSAGSPMKPRR